MGITIVKRNKGIKYGARKYIKVRSDTDPKKTYVITKVRKRNSKNYKYMCTCMDFIMRNHPCKHIKRFQTKEKE